MPLATLSIDLVAKVASFEKDLKRVADSAEQQSNRMAQAFGIAKGGLAALAAGFSVGAIAGFVRDANNAIDALNDVADATGASIESISALENVARNTGANLDTVSGVLVKFNQVLNDTNPNSGAAQTLRAIGLSAEELRRIDPAEALQRTARALAGFADDGNKARAVQELFGKSVREAAPFLKDLAEAGKLNATITSQQAEEADRFNKELFKLQKNGEDFARVVSIDIVTAINAAAKAYRESGLFAAGGVLLFGDDDFKNSKRLVELTDDLLQAENELAAARSGGSALDSARARQAQERVNSIKKEIDAIMRLRNVSNPNNQSEAETARLMRRQSVVIPPIARAPQASTPARDTPFNGLTYDDKITQRAGELLQESDVNRAREYADTLRKLDELYFSAGISQEDYDSAMKKLIGSTGAAADKTSEFIKYQERLEALLRDSEVDEQRKDMEALARALSENTINESEYLEAVTRRLNLVGEKTKEAKGFADEFGLAFSSAFEDAIVKGESLSKVIEGLGQDILRIALRKSVTEPLGNAVSGFFGNLFSFDGGGYTGSGSRTGGMDGKGGFLAMVHPNESIIDHTKGGGQSVVVHQNFTVGDVASVSMVRQAVAGSEARIASSLNRSMKYGGAPV